MCPTGTEREGLLHHHLPWFEYTSAITDPYLKNNEKCLDSIEHYTACFVTNNCQRCYNPDEEHISVAALLEEFGWEDHDS